MSVLNVAKSVLCALLGSAPVNVKSCFGRAKLKHVVWTLAAVLLLGATAMWMRQTDNGNNNNNNNYGHRHDYEHRYGEEVEGESLLPNRTSEAKNQRLVVFYRVPKTGSEMMQVNI